MSSTADALDLRLTRLWATASPLRLGTTAMLATGGIGMIALLIGMPSDGAAQRLFQPVIVQALVAKVVG